MCGSVKNSDVTLISLASHRLPLYHTPRVDDRSQMELLHSRKLLIDVTGISMATRVKFSTDFVGQSPPGISHIQGTCPLHQTENPTSTS